MRVYNRVLGRYEEENAGDSVSLRFLYRTAVGRLLLKIAVARPFFSNAVSRFHHSRLSRLSIKGFVKKNNIDLSEWDIDDFRCFNDFFIRKKDFTDTSLDNELISVADSRLSAYRIRDGLKLNIKNSEYSVSSLLGDSKIADRFHSGWCLVFRLCVDDYHRYSYADSGVITAQYEVKGQLHTVRPIACDFNPYSTNHRVVNLLSCDRIGDAAQIEVGALMVGRIKNHDGAGAAFKKGQEKGYFEFGGSTVILLVGDCVEIDRDIVENTERDIETKVRLGDVIGKIKG